MPSFGARPAPWLDDLVAASHRVSLIDAVTALTLFLVVTWGFASTVARLPAQIALMCVLLRPELLRSPYLWSGLSIVSTMALLQEWSSADNHKYLLVYWLYVVTLATAVRNEEFANSLLTWHARFFIIFVFLAASLQKSFSPTYMSGEMFELKLLLDERFKAFGHLLGFDKNDADAARVALARLKSPMTEFEDNAVLMPANDRSRLLAVAITWYDVLVQFAIGLLFIPARKLTDRMGHIVLLFFIFTTYLPAPVFGFGWTLSIYGFAVSRDRAPLISLAYATAFAAVLAYQAPWRDWVLNS